MYKHRRAMASFFFLFSAVAVNEMTFLCRFPPGEVIRQISIFLYLLRVICSVLRRHQWFRAAKNQATTWLKILWILLMANKKKNPTEDPFVNITIQF